MSHTNVHKLEDQVLRAHWLDLREAAAHLTPKLKVSLLRRRGGAVWALADTAPAIADCMIYCGQAIRMFSFWLTEPGAKAISVKAKDFYGKLKHYQIRVPSKSL